MNILVCDAGAQGSQYAARLHKAGHEVSILASGQRSVSLSEIPVGQETIGNEQHVVTPVNVVRSLEPEDAYDLIIVLMRKNQTPTILRALAVNRRTPSFLFWGDHVADPDEFVAALGRKCILSSCVEVKK